MTPRTDIEARRYRTLPEKALRGLSEGPIGRSGSVSLLRIGFTGTAKGMTPYQATRVNLYLASFAERGAVEFHHGDCIGADSEAHDLARKNGLLIVGHPPVDPKARAFRECDMLWEELPYLVRNHDIVHATNIMIVAPRSRREELRSGTWATYRYAMAANRDCRMAWPMDQPDA